MKPKQKLKFIQVIIVFFLAVFGAQSTLLAGPIGKREHIISKIIEAADAEAIAPASFLLGIARVESNFQRVKSSNQGDIGVFQFDPHLLVGLENLTNNSLKDEISHSVALINRLFTKYEGNRSLVLIELKNDGRVGGWPNNRVLPDESSYIFNVLAAEKIFQTMLNAPAYQANSEKHFYLELNTKTNSNFTSLSGENFRSGWPVWKKELYLVKHLLNGEPLYTNQTKLEQPYVENKYISQLNSLTDFVGGSRINLNEDDF